MNSANKISFKVRFHFEPYEQDESLILIESVTLFLVHHSEKCEELEEVVTKYIGRPLPRTELRAFCEELTVQLETAFAREGNTLFS